MLLSARALASLSTGVLALVSVAALGLTLARALALIAGFDALTARASACAAGGRREIGATLITMSPAAIAAVSGSAHPTIDDRNQERGAAGGPVRAMAASIA